MPAGRIGSLAAQARALANSAGAVSAWAASIAKDAAALADAASALAQDIRAMTGVPAGSAAVAASIGAIHAAGRQAPALAAPAPVPAVPAAGPAAAPAAAAIGSAAAKPEGEPAPDSANARPDPMPAVASPDPAPAVASPQPAPAVASPQPTPAVASPDPAPAVASPDPTSTDPCSPDETAGYATSAAAMFGWGQPNRVEDFSGSLDKSWGLYDGPGHMGNGKRTPSAVSIKDGVMTITGDPQGNTEGMAWNPGQRYGRWEGRIKAPVSDRSYNALLLLWPDAENWPVGGEVDFMEMSDHTRQSTNLYLHYGKNNSQLQGTVNVDATQWHNWAVEWTADHITAFLDGRQWWTTNNTAALPPGPMHLCIQLDWFPKSGSSVQTSEMDVDWVRQYSLSADTTGTGSAAATEGAPDAAHAGTPSGSSLHTVAPPAVKAGLVPAAVATP